MIKCLFNGYNYSHHRGKDAKKHLMAIRKSCRNFFIEVVSRLCFGQSSPPEDELVAMLLDIMFTEQGEKREGEAGGEGEGVRRGTRDLTPYEEKKDENPIIRSFLLQLLLEHKYVCIHDDDDVCGGGFYTAQASLSFSSPLPVLRQ